MRCAGKIHAADADKSARLLRVLGILADHGWHGTREILRAADVCAVNTIVSELRENGHLIDCRCIGRGRYVYRLVPKHEQLSLLPAAA